MAQQPLIEWLASKPLPRTGFFQTGYEAEPVDALIDKIVARMEAGRQFSDLVERAEFPASKARTGYRAQAVDDLFDNLKWGSDPRE